MTRGSLFRALWRARAHGQVLVLFAVALVALVGMMGLAIDLGFMFSQKRAIQNAADAGALAGALQLTKSTPSNPLPVQNEIAQIVAQNGFGGATPQLVSCEYIDSANTALGPCAAPPPADAAGVQVVVRETHPTFFIQVVPGAPDQASTQATARARVFKVMNGPGDAPFIICGVGTKVMDGSSVSILNADGTLNAAAIGKTFEVHGPQIADCGAPSSKFKGLADQDANEGLGVGDWFISDNGVKAGPTRVRVNGVGGCQKGADGDFNCIMVLPIATDNPPPVKAGPNIKLKVVAFGVFRVSACGANCHQAELLGQYVIGPGDPNDGWIPDLQDDWQVGDNGLLMVRLVG
ncbi:MAG: pilus assembly protein TadG-related protein [Sphaerobacter sp.]|nr:pilus assembly protein TadG-related protein [Sphaerobacter sp.]